MASPSAGAPALKYGDVNIETTSPRGQRVNGKRWDGNGKEYNYQYKINIGRNTFKWRKA